MEIETLYFFHNCNSYLISNNKQCLLIDPGFNSNNCLINAIKKRGLTLKGILLTHGHYDHIEGLKDIKDIPVYMYKSEAECLINSKYNCSFMSLNPFVINNIKPILIEDEETLKLININIKVIHTPFHSSGSVCFYIKEAKTVFTGDTLFYNAIGRSDLPTSEERKIKDSLNKLFLLPHKKEDDTLVYPGHGRATSLYNEYRFIKNEYLI